jgi:hypothetical protein
MSRSYTPAWLSDVDDAIKAQQRARNAVRAIRSKQDEDHATYDPDWTPYPLYAWHGLGPRTTRLGDELTRQLEDGPLQPNTDLPGLTAEFDAIAQLAEWVLSR